MVLAFPQTLMLLALSGMFIDVIRKVVGDMTAAGVDIDESVVRRALDEQAIEARRQLMEAQ